MPVRTLVIGIPLRDASFDNHSFAPAPTGTEITDQSHLFADYVARFGSRMACRVTIPGKLESTVRVFARSTGGEAAGFEMPLLASSIVFVPPLTGEAEDRSEIAGTLFQCFERLPAAKPGHSSEWIRKQAG